MTRTPPVVEFPALGVAQTCPLAGDVAQNSEQHLRLAALAAERGAQVLVFPELSLTGYELELAEELAFSEDDARLAPLARAAGRHALTLIVGAPVRLAARLHIGAFALYPDQSRTLYTKQRLGAFAESARVDGRLPPPEPSVFQSGGPNPLIRAGRLSAGLAICADVGSPLHLEQALACGAALYLASMFVIRSEFEQDSARLAGYAARHRMPVALANFGGPSGGLAAAGRSSLWSQTGERIAELPAEGAGVAVALLGAQGWGVELALLDARFAAEA